MDIEEYLQNPCGTLSIPYWKAKTLTLPDSIRMIHCRDWNGQYSDYQRYFRVKHSLKDLAPIDFDYDTISIDSQAKELSFLIMIGLWYTQADRFGFEGETNAV